MRNALGNINEGMKQEDGENLNKRFRAANRYVQLRRYNNRIQTPTRWMPGAAASDRKKAQGSSVTTLSNDQRIPGVAAVEYAIAQSSTHDAFTRCITRANTNVKGLAQQLKKRDETKQ